MAHVDMHTEHDGRGSRSGPAAASHRGQYPLAEVIRIRPERSHRPGLIGSLVAIARAIASPRAQAASVGTSPRPPSSPAPLSFLPPQVPHDAA